MLSLLLPAVVFRGIAPGGGSIAIAGWHAASICVLNPSGAVGKMMKFPDVVSVSGPHDGTDEPGHGYQPDHARDRAIPDAQLFQDSLPSVAPAVNALALVWLQRGAIRSATSVWMASFVTLGITLQPRAGRAARHSERHSGTAARARLRPARARPRRLRGLALGGQPLLGSDRAPCARLATARSARSTSLRAAAVGVAQAFDLAFGGGDLLGARAFLAPSRRRPPPPSLSRPPSPFDGRGLRRPGCRRVDCGRRGAEQAGDSCSSTSRASRPCSSVGARLGACPPPRAGSRSRAGSDADRRPRGRPPPAPRRPRRASRRGPGEAPRPPRRTPGPPRSSADP